MSARQRRWLDIALVGTLLVFVPGYAFVEHGAIAVALSIAQIVPLLWRRDHAIAVFVAVAAASAVQVPLYSQPLHSQLAFPVAVYSVARFTHAWAGWAALAVGSVASFVAAADWIDGLGGEVTTETMAPYVVTIGATVVAAWALGTLGRTRDAYVGALIDRAERVEREAAQQVALAASVERARIAREMHDIVAHGLTTIVVQADGARYASAAKPELASSTLETIAETARDALAEMRRLLGVLRAGDTGTAPQPTLSDIAELTAGVDARLVGLDRHVADGVALTAYRVVQEALNNVRKHAGPGAHASAEVRVTDAIEIVVDDDGRGASAIDDGKGLGLIGIRERVTAHDGTVEAGPRPGGGYRLQVRIPL